MYVVIVDFEIHAACVSEFLPKIIDNARISRNAEPGCRQFDICRDLKAPERIFLYELYDDLAAFEAHLASAHFQSFAAATGQMVANKRLRAMERIDP